MLVFSLLAPAFISGLFMFFAPCTLPMVPSYLAFMSGVSGKNPSPDDIRRIKKNSIFFVLGFSTVFISLGILLGLVGHVISPYRDILVRFGGVLIVVFGIMMLGIQTLPFFNRDFRLPIPKWLSIGKPHSSFTIGAIFALGWSPCIGPILGTLLILAGSLGTVFQGALLLAIFSLGFAVPFLITALYYQKLHSRFSKNTHIFKIFSIVGGILMIGIGILLILNQWHILEEWGFKIFNFIEYDTIQSYL